MATDPRGRDTNPFDEPEPDSSVSIDDMRRQQQQIIAGISNHVVQFFLMISGTGECVSFSGYAWDVFFAGLPYLLPVRHAKKVLSNNYMPKWASWSLCCHKMASSCPNDKPC